MNLGSLLHQFFADGKVYAACAAIVLDFLLGVLAAFKLGTFRLSYVSDFLRNDVLFKLVPYFVLYSAAVVAGNTQIIIPGLDVGDAAGAAYVVAMAAWAGSIISSLAQLGLGAGTAPAAIAGAENAAPPKD